MTDAASIDMDAIDWRKQDGLLPAIVQHADTLRVLMQGYMSREALAATLASGKVTFFSRSRQRLWTKGETSGNLLQLVSVQADCDADSLLVLARPQGPTCHTGTISCFATAPGDALARWMLRFLDFIAAKRGLTSTAYPGKGFYYLGGLTEASETIAVFAAMCFFPTWFPPLAYAFAALCGVTTVTRLAAGIRMFGEP